MYNKTLIDRLSDVKDDVIDVCTTRWQEIVLTVVILYALAGGRRRWMNVNHLIMLCETYFIICPQSYFKTFFDGTPDEAHKQLFQLAMMLVVCQLLCYWLLSKSTDSTTETSLLLAYTVMLCCMLLASVYGMSHQSKKPVLTFKEDAKVLFFYSQMSIVVGSLYFFLSAKDWGGYGEVMSSANFHLRADFVLLMVMGLLMYALPQWMIRLMTTVDKVDSMHAFMCRCCGAMLMSMSLVSGRAANFLRNADKDAVAFSHFVLYLLLVVGSVCAVCRDWGQLQWKQTGLKIAHDLLLVVNAAGALNFDFLAFEKILLPRLKALPGEMEACWKSCTKCCSSWLKWKRA